MTNVILLNPGNLLVFLPLAIQDLLWTNSNKSKTVTMENLDSILTQDIAAKLTIKR